MENRLPAYMKLRDTYKPYAELQDGHECISFPFPNERGGISIMIRLKDQPNTLREIEIVRSDYVK